MKLEGLVSLTDDKAKGVTIVPDNIPSKDRAALEAEGCILVTATEALNGPVDFDC